MPDTDVTYHVESGRVRLPREVAAQWRDVGYGTASEEDFYSVLWWIADMGYSIIPDEQYHEFLKNKEEA